MSLSVSVGIDSTRFESCDETDDFGAGTGPDLRGVVAMKSVSSPLIGVSLCVS